MLRGVNRQIIEVNETDSRYFEKAILFVRPGCDEKEGNLQKQARQLIDNLGVPAGNVSRASLVLQGARLISAAAAGAMICFAVMQLI
ncbi:MAG: hypothetical protein HFE85_03580 [Clostridiales bacterium]|nr:hypothetical protein [Clostridiales bacterium]